MGELTDSGFVLTPGCIDMGEMDAAQVAERTEAVRSWVHPFAKSLGVSATELQAETIRSFDVFTLGDVGLWLLHNRFVSVVGAIAAAPVPGRGWAVDQTFVNLTVPFHLLAWGPCAPAARDLNAELTEKRWGSVSQRAREYADRYKPETVGQVLFNYWD